ncbi:MAG: retropepsin-like aspartic protease [Pirellulales bacterium]
MPHRSLRQSARCLIVVLVFIAAAPAIAGTRRIEIDLGPLGNFALDQPRVQIRVHEDIDDPVGFGPEFSNSFLLDTGSTSILSVGSSASELESAGYETEGTFLEQGVAGFVELDVSKSYRVDVAGSDGVPHTLTDIRLLSDPAVNDFGSFAGIVGMPAMQGRVTSLDNTVWEGGNIAFMGVDFSSSLPAENGHRYTVPLRPLPFPQEGEPPLPTAAPLPLMTVVAAHNGATSYANLVVDTGAQLSLISTQLAEAIGLDVAGATEFVEVGGIGGSIQAPVLSFDELRVPTKEGVDIVFGGVEAIVLDIHPNIDGVFSAAMMTSGWFEALFGEAASGDIDQVHFDFRDFPAGPGEMVFDLDGAADQLVLPSGAYVTGRHLFYNNSKFDGPMGLNDSAAIAVDKSALMPGNLASFENYTSYNRGINGVMIDIANMTGDPSLADFVFRAGREHDTALWEDAPAPESITVLEGAGEDGADRIVIVWPDEAITDQWLEVTVLPTAETGLDELDVFYFGNAVAESGNAVGATFVSPADELGARNNTRGFLNQAPIDFRFDYNRDGLVDPADQLSARNNGVGFGNSLPLLVAPFPTMLPPAAAALTAVPEPSSLALGLIGCAMAAVFYRRGSLRRTGR